MPEPSPFGPAEPGEVRERIMAAAIRCVERDGVRKLSMEAVAAEVGLSRTTLYRQFPGGRGQLVSETATWEVGRFWRRLAEAVSDLPTMEERLVAGLVLGTKLIRRSTIMANLLEPEMDELVSALRPSESIVHQVIRDYLRDLLEVEALDGRLRPGIDTDEAADYLTRMMLSYLGSPAGWDLADRDQTRRLVRTEFLAGIVEPPTS